MLLSVQEQLHVCISGLVLKSANVLHRLYLQKWSLHTTLLPLCNLVVLTLGNVLLLRCGQSAADTQPAQCHDLPKKQLRSQHGGDVRRPLPLCAVSALWSRLRSPACCHGRRGHPVTLHRQHPEGPQVRLDSSVTLLFIRRVGPRRDARQ